MSANQVQETSMNGVKSFNNIVRLSVPSKGFLKKTSIVDSGVQSDSSQMGQESIHSTETSSPYIKDFKDRLKEIMTSHDSFISNSAFSKPSRKVELNKDSNCDLKLEKAEQIFTQKVLKEDLHFHLKSVFSYKKRNEMKVANFYKKVYKANRNHNEWNTIQVPVKKIPKVVQIQQSDAKMIARSPEIINDNINLLKKRSAPESTKINSNNMVDVNEESFLCHYCGEEFNTGQALGGHMSRKHSGKSEKYNHKKDVRKQREFDRMKLHAAKNKYFEELGYDYDLLLKTREGKIKAKAMVNRGQIKKIKVSLTETEIFNLNGNSSN